jgi:hypothetical protein
MSDKPNAQTYRFFKPEIGTDASVDYKVLDKDGRELDKKAGWACFSSLTYDSIPRNIDRIVVTRGANELPYDQAAIVLWINDLTALGFPVEVSFPNGGPVTFTLHLKDYDRKVHLSSALSLVRCLWEQTICLVPDVYLTRIKKASSLTAKWKILQDSHRAIKDMKRPPGHYGANTNHMVTYAGNGENISRAAFWDKVKGTKPSVYDKNREGYGNGGSDNTYVSVDGTWRT